LDKIYKADIKEEHIPIWLISLVVLGVLGILAVLFVFFFGTSSV
jgi:hypothetical protein